MSCFFEIFLTKSFLGCMSLKTGTYVISGWNLLFTLGFAYYVSSSILEAKKDEVGVISTIVLTLPWGFIVCGIYTSIQILCWLPTCNGKNDSAKMICYGLIDVYCLLESAIYNALLAVFGALIYACSAEVYALNHESHSFYDRYLPSVIFAHLLLLCTHFYFALIEYSLYKVIKGNQKNKGKAEIPLSLVTGDQ